MYNAVLTAHSWLRWAVIIVGLIAVVRAIMGVSGRRPWTRADDRAGFWFSTLIDLQMLIGLLMYFALSPITRAAMQDFGAAMRSSGLRFWAVEHTFGMIVAVALVHAGRSRTKKLTESRSAAQNRSNLLCARAAGDPDFDPVAWNAERAVVVAQSVAGSQVSGSRFGPVRHFFVMLTPPLDVLTLMGAPPPPSVASTSRGSCARSPSEENRC